MQAIWYAGSYGRGTLSRSRPDTAFDAPAVANPDAFVKDEEFLVLSPYEVAYMHWRYPNLFNFQDANDIHIELNTHKLAVYMHFRQLGYVVRHGLSFGAEWLLYQDGPVFSHAFASVCIESTQSLTVKEMLAQ